VSDETFVIHFTGADRNPWEQPPENDIEKMWLKEYEEKYVF
jgi:lipopolysaccharide biosynthesis glycosyltransferase